MSKKLKTASLSSKLTGSYKKCIELAFGIEVIALVFVPTVNTKTCKGFLSWHRLLLQ